MRELHRAVLRRFLQTGDPPATGWIAGAAARLGLTGAAVAELEAAELVHAASGVVSVAYPFSGTPTRQQVELDGFPAVYAMYAIDALGIPAMAGRDGDTDGQILDKDAAIERGRRNFGPLLGGTCDQRCQPGFLRHAYIHGGAGVALPRGATPPRGGGSSGCAGQTAALLAAPLTHNPDFERFPSRTIDAICYQAKHPARAPGCRCGLYAAIEGTLDSLPGYLSDSAHDRDPPIYAEVACAGRVLVDSRGLRAQRIEILRLATRRAPVGGGPRDAPGRAT